MRPTLKALVTSLFMATVAVTAAENAWAQTCIDPPAIDGEPAYNAVPTGWSFGGIATGGFSSITPSPDIINGTDPHPANNATIYDLNGTSASGGNMAFFVGVKAESDVLAEGIKTTLTGLTVGSVYEVAVEWQQVRTGAYAGGGLTLSANTSSVTEQVSSELSSDAHGWEVAKLTFTAQSASEEFEIRISDPAVNYGAIVVDAGSACSGDTTAPTLTSSSPADGAADVAIDANITLTFDQAVVLETGTIVIKRVSDNTIVESFDVATSSAITGSGTATITINPTSEFDYSTGYYIEIADTAVDDTSGNSYAGITGATTLNFTTVAEPEQNVYFIYNDGPPSNTTPANADCPIGAIEVGASEAYGRTAMNNPGPGDFPGQTLETSKTYGHVNSTVNLYNTTSYRGGTWTYEDPQPSTKPYGGMICYGPASLVPAQSDTTGPTLASTSPAHNATDVAIDAVIELTFDEPVVAGDGYFYLYDEDGEFIEQFYFGVASPNAPTISQDGLTVTLTPSAAFDYEMGYIIRTSSPGSPGSPVEDAAGNEYAGISEYTTYNFRTGAAPDTTAPTATFNPTNGSTGVARNATITLTFSEAVTLLDGTALTNENIGALLTLKDTDGNGADIPFTATISGDVITIVPDSDFDVGQQVYVAIGATVEDAADNAISPTSSTFTVFEDDAAPTVTFNPRNGSTGVARDSTITLTFSEAVRLRDDSEITNADLADLLTLKDTDGSGADIPFTATISGNVITITPDAPFSSSQQIYAAIGASVEDAFDNAISPASTTFTIADTVAPTVIVSGPTEPVTEAFTVTFTFSEDVTGFTAGDISLAGGTLSNFSGSGSTYTALVTPTLGETVTVSVPANAAQDASANGNQVSNTYTIQAGSPASEFEANRAVIEDLLVGDMMRSVRSSVSTSSRMVREARGRFISMQQCADDTLGSNLGAGASDRPETSGCTVRGLSNTVTPLSIDGSASASATTVSTSGIVTAETSTNYGQSRRLFFGDFDIQRDNDTGNTTSTLSARMTWERMVQSNTMLGYFLGAEFANSDLNGEFSGDQSRFGVTAGGYVVQRLSEHLYADGYLSAGLGDNDLDISNGTLALESNYDSQTVVAGVAVSGHYAHEQYEFRPELAFTYGRAELGTVGFTGTAYGITDDSLSLDAGSVTITNLTFRPEVLLSLSGGPVAQSGSVISFAPRLICEQINATLRADTDECGAGAELGLKARSEDGLSSIDFRIAVDEIGNTRRSTGQLGIELRF